jgi:glycosyltransferase involved in cell wall biosynthesis
MMSKNNKLLYIGRNTDALAKVGGNIVRKNHEDALSLIFGNRFYKYLLTTNHNKWVSLFNKIFFNFFPEVTLSTFFRIDRIITEVQPQIVYVESSNYGKLVKYIKKKYKVTVITFFHNIEVQLAKSYISLFNIKSWLFYFISQKNEKETVEYSDKFILLNKRDAELFENIYGKKADCLLPVAFKDVVNINMLMKNRRLISKKECLFVGTNFRSNIEGLNWFIKNVMPFVDIELLIIGKGMSEVFLNKDRIIVMDYVEDLSNYYMNADFIIGPIFSGGGMKTKTAEAMMWGKAIIGTDEAFCGYESDNIKGLYRCNTSDEMIQAIKSIYQDKIFNFNMNIRDIYLSKYSFDTSLEILKDFFKLI